MNATTITENYIREAYTTLGGGTVRLAALTLKVPASPRLIARVLTKMALEPGVHLRSEADQKTLTAADHQAAITLGGTARHTLLIEG